MIGGSTGESSNVTHLLGVHRTRFDAGPEARGEGQLCVEVRLEPGNGRFPVSAATTAPSTSSPCSPAPWRPAPGWAPDAPRRRAGGAAWRTGPWTPSCVRTAVTGGGRSLGRSLRARRRGSGRVERHRSGDQRAPRVRGGRPGVPRALSTAAPRLEHLERADRAHKARASPPRLTAGRAGSRGARLGRGPLGLGRGFGGVGVREGEAPGVVLADRERSMAPADGWVSASTGSGSDVISVAKYRCRWASRTTSPGSTASRMAGIGHMRLLSCAVVPILTSRSLPAARPAPPRAGSTSEPGRSRRPPPGAPASPAPTTPGTREPRPPRSPTGGEAVFRRRAIRPGTVRRILRL